MPDEVPTNRGSLQFLITPAGDLANSATNVRLLAQLWADRTLIRGDDLGPGDPGDFDHGAWHSSCHLLGAGGAPRQPMAASCGSKSPTPAFAMSISPASLFATRASRRRSRSIRPRVACSWRTPLSLVSSRGTPPAAHRHATSSMPPTGSTSGGGRISISPSPRYLREGRSGNTGVPSATCGRPTGLGCRRSRPTCLSSRPWEIGSAPRSRAAGANTATPSNSARSSTPGFVGADSATWNATPTPIPAGVEPLFLDAEPERGLTAVEQTQLGEAAEVLHVRTADQVVEHRRPREDRPEEVRRRPQAGLITPPVPPEER